MPDRRRLAASVLALAVSFAAVLILGAASGQAHGVELEVAAVSVQETPLPGQPAKPRPTATPRTSGEPRSSSRASTAALVSDTFYGSQVVVLEAKSLRLVASGQLNPGDNFTTRVTEGSYLVCLSPPSGWKPASDAVSRIPGWICTTVKPVGASAATVIFRLVRPTSSAAGVTR
jgi:hypothetical protein